MNEVLLSTTFFGVAISLVTYFFAMELRKRLDYAIVNPLLISTILTIAFLLVFNVDYETYNQGAQYLSVFLTPATICLAVPLYRQLHVLKKNVVAVIVSISCGVIAHGFNIIVLAQLFGLKEINTRGITCPFTLSKEFISPTEGAIKKIGIIESSQSASASI